MKVQKTTRTIAQSPGALSTRSPKKTAGPRRVDAGDLPPKKRGQGGLGAETYGATTQRSGQSRALPKSSPALGASVVSPEDAALKFMNKLLVHDRMGIDDVSLLIHEKAGKQAGDAYDQLSHLRSLVFRRARSNYGATYSDEEKKHNALTGHPLPDKRAPFEPIPQSAIELPAEGLSALKKAARSRRFGKSMSEHLGKLVNTWERRSHSKDFRALRDQLIERPEAQPPTPPSYSSSRPGGIIYNSVEDMPPELRGVSRFKALERTIAEKGRNGFIDDVRPYDLPDSALGTAELAKQAFAQALPRVGIALMEKAQEQGLDPRSTLGKELEHQRRNANTHEANRAVRFRPLG